MSETPLLYGACRTCPSMLAGAEPCVSCPGPRLPVRARRLARRALAGVRHAADVAGTALMNARRPKW